MIVKSSLIQFILIFTGLLVSRSGLGQVTGASQQDRWTIQSKESIIWNVKDRLPHTDHIEMSGEKVSLWVQYKIDTNRYPEVVRTIVFPTFRTLPDNTRSHIDYTVYDNQLPRFTINNRILRIGPPATTVPKNQGYRVQDVSQHGIMDVDGTIGDPAILQLHRSFFPSKDKPMAVEEFVFTNLSASDVNVSMEYLRNEIKTDSIRSKGHRHSIITESLNDGTRVLKPGGTVTFAIVYRATDFPQSAGDIDIEAEEAARVQRIKSIQSHLTLQTPDSILNTEFEFAKLRATESIYKTRAGYIHSPGGLSYYAAIWANDQAEYVSPFFAFSGDSIGIRSAMNCYSLFARYMNPDYKPIPSSIVAEADAYWNGAGDRGDQAMIAYGASRFALAYGKPDSARKLWPLIKWCLEYCNRKLNDQGVATSDKDELEGRFPAGKANLSTNSLYYDALISAAYLAKQLHEPAALSNQYLNRAAILRKHIEKYFGGTIEGFETYRYYETNDVLRAWICLPLTVGIYDRAEGTVNALFSPRLWTADGLATQAGKETFWDRSTLYALRGVFQAGRTKKALDYLHYYSRRRLLGEHVPYPVEAYPEGNQRHLAAESGLYCRIFTEGMFGIRPTGFRTFDCTPRLPEKWKSMSLQNIHAFGAVFNVEVSRKQNGLRLSVITNDKRHNYTLKEGQTLTVRL